MNEPKSSKLWKLFGRIGDHYWVEGARIMRKHYSLPDKEPKNNEVIVVMELIGSWDNQEISNLLGVYKTTEQAKESTTQFVQNLPEEILDTIIGYEFATMNIIEDGTQEVYGSIAYPIEYFKQ